MSHFDERKFEEDAKRALDGTNQETRCPCVLLLDTSGSMTTADKEGKSAIRKLNEGLQTLKQAIANDKTARNRVELALITFGGPNVETICGFCHIDEFNPGELTANGGTSIGQALDMDEKAEYSERLFGN